MQSVHFMPSVSSNLESQIPPPTNPFIPVAESTPRPIASQQPRRNPVLTWTVRFSAQPEDSVESFIKKVEDLIKAHSVTNVELMNGAFHLFTGAARPWFDATCPSNRT